MITIAVVVGFGGFFWVLVVFGFVFVVLFFFFCLFILLTLFPEKLLDLKTHINLEDTCE